MNARCLIRSPVCGWVRIWRTADFLREREYCSAWAGWTFDVDDEHLVQFIDQHDPDVVPSMRPTVEWLASEGWLEG
jgi:hypothetical protein